jgi:hypothetical protein
MPCSTRLTQTVSASAWTCPYGRRNDHPSKPHRTPRPANGQSRVNGSVDRSRDDGEPFVQPAVPGVAKNFAGSGLSGAWPCADRRESLTTPEP